MPTVTESRHQNAQMHHELGSISLGNPDSLRATEGCDNQGRDACQVSARLVPPLISCPITLELSFVLTQCQVDFKGGIFRENCVPESCCKLGHGSHWWSKDCYMLNQTSLKSRHCSLPLFIEAGSLKPRDPQDQALLPGLLWRSCSETEITGIGSD